MGFKGEVKGYKGQAVVEFENGSQKVIETKGVYERAAVAMLHVAELAAEIGARVVSRNAVIVRESKPEAA